MKTNVATVSRDRAYELMEMYHSGDPVKVKAAKDEMVLGMQGWIAKIISNNFPTYRGEYFHDLMQQGSVAVLLSMDKYDPEKGSPSNYFYRQILHEMQTFVATQINQTTPHYNGAITQIKKKMQEFNARGVDYEEADLAYACGIPLKTVERCLEIMRSTATQAEYDDAFANGAESIQSPEEALEENMREEVFTRVLGKLPKEMRTILFMRMEPTNRRGKQTPYKVIAKEIGASIEQTKKWYQEAIAILRKDPELRNYFTDYYGEIEERELDKVTIPTTQDDEINEIQAMVQIILPKLEDEEN